MLDEFNSVCEMYDKPAVKLVFSIKTANLVKLYGKKVEKVFGQCWGGGGGALDLHSTGRCPQNSFILNRLTNFVRTIFDHFSVFQAYFSETFLTVTAFFISKNNILVLYWVCFSRLTVRTLGFGGK